MKSKKYMRWANRSTERRSIVAELAIRACQDTRNKILMQLRKNDKLFRRVCLQGDVAKLLK